MHVFCFVGSKAKCKELEPLLRTNQKTITTSASDSLCQAPPLLEYGAASFTNSAKFAAWGLGNISKDGPAGGHGPAGHACRGCCRAGACMVGSPEGHPGFGQLVDPLEFKCVALIGQVQ